MGTNRRYSGCPPDSRIQRGCSGSACNLGECTGEVGNCGCIHAEDNLLSNNKGIKIIYVNYSPCINCAKKIVEYGIKTVIYT